ncbi:15971_t:CDS:2 [Acaulospora colombiana]|uniref:15971_t:CDS:1 n=1 Tax=Acaulospora colombiana TaxID=27376 RepID=A0ACA9KD82_9GLOM|nr:15971_t:CDS:2 [Acaulospora colombiana]
MGNSMNKDKAEETVDGGQLVPHGVYKLPQDWDVKSVRKFIIERKLAPFYKGLADYDESWDEVTLTTHNLPKSVEAKKSSAFNGECHAQGSQVLRRSATLNTPICTECFVQIKRPESGTLGANNSPAVCPFCVETNFGVYYKPPPFSAGVGSENMPNSIQNLSNSQPSQPSSSSSLSVPDKTSIGNTNWQFKTGGYLAAMRMGTDLEELMVMEAIRLSLLEQNERDRGEREESERTEGSPDENSNNALSSEDSASGTITIPHLSTNEEGAEEVALYENQPGNEGDNLIVESVQSDIESHFSGQVPIYHSDNEEEDEISSASHSHDYTPTNVSTPITTSTEGGTITSTSVPSSSTGSGLSSPSTTNSTNDVLSPSSFPLNDGNTSEITEIVEGSGERDRVPFDNDAQDVPPTFELEQGQTPEHAGDIKKSPEIILSSASLVEEEIVRNEGGDETNQAIGGS